MFGAIFCVRRLIEVDVVFRFIRLPEFRRITLGLFVAGWMLVRTNIGL